VVKKILPFFVVLNLVFLVACQNESAEETHSTVATIIKTTPLTTYVERMAMQKTSHDNIIDQSNYCTLKLPYEVEVNWATIAINSPADYQKVIDNINAFSTDNDVIKITFPVTMVLYNYKEKVLSNQAEFENLLAIWYAKPDLLSKINCLNINYPIRINTYNADKQLANSYSFANDKSVFDFINTIDVNQFIGFNYPITVSNPTTYQSTNVFNNKQFEAEINRALSTCVENIPSENLDFFNTITSCSWKICYAYNDSDKTQIYNDLNFTFKTDYTVEATKNGFYKTGTWSTKLNNGTREFRIKFNSDPLKNLDQNWDVFEFNASKLRFTKKEDILETDYLFFDKI
jgi:hypothetical protein